jgi:hypothetical protein
MEVSQEQFDLLCEAATILHDSDEAHAAKVAEALDDLLADTEVVEDEDDEDDEDDEQDEDDEAD